MVADFEKINTLVLSYPSKFKDPYYRQLCGFYDELINLLPDDIRLFLIINKEGERTKIESKFFLKKIFFIVVPGFDEIWLRDFLGFPSKGNKVFLPRFQPSYFKAIYTRDYLNRLNDQIKIIHQALELESIEIDLVWDGGNFIHNKKIGFVTEKILCDNPNKSTKEITDIISYKTDIKPVFIPINSYDKLAHADGYLNFINENVLAVSNYPEYQFLLDSLYYGHELKNIAKNQGLSIIRIADRPVCERVKVNDEYIDSARGVFNNFLQINRTLIFPHYSLPRDKFGINYYKKNLEGIEKYFDQVRTINCDSVSKLGGSLHCISWCF